MDPEKPTLQQMAGQKPTPNDLVSLDLLICERVMREASDDVISIIRMVDVFYVLPPIGAEENILPMQIFVGAKFSPGASKDRTMELTLIRPDGERKSMGGLRNVQIESKFPDLPAGFVMLIQAGIKVQQLGTHYIAVSVDGKELRKAPFTLLPQTTQAD